MPCYVSCSDTVAVHPVQQFISNVRFVTVKQLKVISIYVYLPLSVVCSVVTLGLRVVVICFEL
jgi:hypothetical protein